MTKDEALKLALEVLKSQIVWFSTDTMIGKSMRQKTEKAITALEEALAQPEPMAIEHCLWARNENTPCPHTTPPQRKPDNEAYTALEQALTRLQKRYGELEAKVAAQPEPMAIEHCLWARNGNTPCPHTTSPQRTWVGLESEEIRKAKHHIVDGAYHYSFKQGAEWADAKLKEKNT